MHARQTGPGQPQDEQWPWLLTITLKCLAFNQLESHRFTESLSPTLPRRTGLPKTSRGGISTSPALPSGRHFTPMDPANLPSAINRFRESLWERPRRSIGQPRGRSQCSTRESGNHGPEGVTQSAAHQADFVQPHFFDAGGSRCRG